MIIYSVQITIQNEHENNWLDWMVRKHIPDVMATGYFYDFAIRKQLSPTPAEMHQVYAIEFRLHSLEQLEEYRNKEAPRLRSDSEKMFGGKFTAERKIFIES